jgi:hypothetical protein
MRKTLIENLTQGPLTEPAPTPDEAGLAELAKRVDRLARAKLGRSLSARLTPVHAMAASSKSTRSTTRSMTWSVLACALSRRRDMPTCSW